MKSFKDTLSAARIEKGLSMRHCAAAIDISVVYWSDVERGRRDPFPDREKLKKVAFLLDLDFDTLCDLATRDRKVVKFDLEKFDPPHTDLILRFARLISDLDEDEIIEIQEILGRHSNDQTVSYN